MKIIVFLFFCFFFCHCSRIGFYSGGKVPQDLVIDYKFDSTSPGCNKNQADCVEETPFLQAVHENKPGYLTEYFEIAKRDELEVLFIVDASVSMDDNLKKTGENMSSVLSYIQDKKWRMAFMTADHGDHSEDEITSERWENYDGVLPKFGKLMKLERRGEVLNQFILDRRTSEYKQVFKDTLTRQSPSECDLPPYCHGYNEQPLRSLKAAISRYEVDPENKGFFQPNADTVVVILTDEDERRNDSQNATTAEEVIRTYERIFKGQKKRLFGFSVSIQNKECYSDEKAGFWGSSGAEYGHIVGRLAELTGGHNVSLCSKDYGAALAGISKVTRNLIQSSVVLQKIFYIPKTIQISLSPEQPEISWKLYGRKIVFSNNIKMGTRIKVSYQYE